MENNRHEFCAETPVTLSKFGGVGVTIIASLEGGVQIKLQIKDKETQDAINEFILRTRRVAAVAA